MDVLNSNYEVNYNNNNNSYNDEHNLNGNVDVLYIMDIKEPKNFTCQAQNYFGLVMFNLTITVKGKSFFFILFIYFKPIYYRFCCCININFKFCFKWFFVL